MSHLVIALISAVITLAMGYYLKNLRRFVRHSPTPAAPARPTPPKKILTCFVIRDT